MLERAPRGSIRRAVHRIAFCALQLLQILQRLHHFGVRLGQPRPGALVCAPSQTAQQPRQRALGSFFIRKAVAELVVGEQHAHIRRPLERCVRLRAVAARQRVRVAPFAARRRGLRLAAADHQRVKGHVIAQEQGVKPAVPCADRVTQSAVDLLEPVSLLDPQFGPDRTDKAKHLITLSRRVGARPCVFNLFYRTFADSTRANHTKSVKIHKKFRAFL